MQIDEGIAQFKEDAENNRADLDISFAEENEQIAAWLEELEQYRAIGTVEECRVAVEKQKPKKPRPIDYERYAEVIENAEFLKGAFWCPNCSHVIKCGSFCQNCGQHINISTSDA